MIYTKTDKRAAILCGDDVRLIISFAKRVLISMVVLLEVLI